MNTIKIMKDGRPATRAELCAAAGIPQHTPGNWKAGACHVFDQAQIGVMVDTREEIVIALCGLSEAHDTEESLANAWLIAAAPDLLAACRHALEALTDPENIDEQDAVDVLETAILKATGKE
jgi:hypothetical protein